MLCRTHCNQSAAALTTGTATAARAVVTCVLMAAMVTPLADGADGPGAGAQWSSVGTPVTQLPHMPVVPSPAHWHRSRVTSASSSSPHCYGDAPGPLLHCSPLLPLHMVSQCCSGTCCSLITPSINQYLARAETKRRPDNKWDNQQWAAGYL